METQYNLRSPGVKRLMKEAKELSKPTEQYYAQPLDENLFEWHFSIRGPYDTAFASGVYHGRIILPTEYPMKPPSIIMLTPNGRFELNKKICLSISGFHPESWQPSWSIRTALLAIIGFMPTKGKGAIGSLDYTEKEIKTLANSSLIWKCNQCGSHPANKLLPMIIPNEKVNKEIAEYTSQLNMTEVKSVNEKEKKEEFTDIISNMDVAPELKSTIKHTTESVLVKPTNEIINNTTTSNINAGCTGISVPDAKAALARGEVLLLDGKGCTTTANHYTQSKNSDKVEDNSSISGRVINQKTPCTPSSKIETIGSPTISSSLHTDAILYQRFVDTSYHGMLVGLAGTLIIVALAIIARRICCIISSFSAI